MIPSPVKALASGCLMVVLAGCAPEQAEDEVGTLPVHGSPLCKEGALQAWIGRPRAELEGAQREEDVFRYITPGQRISMDYRPERNNIFVDSNGIVTRITCG